MQLSCDIEFRKNQTTIVGTQIILRGSSIGPALDVLPNGHYFESPQGYLLKAKPCAYRGTRASRVLRVFLGLVEVRVSTECWPGHPRLKIKNKKVVTQTLDRLQCLSHPLLGDIESFIWFAQINDFFFSLNVLNRV